MKSEEYILSEHLEKITTLPYCVYCQGSLDAKNEDRGIVEFLNGWFWICSSCKKLVGATFDETQADPWWDIEIPPYRVRSRKYWLKWIEDNFQIKLVQQK